MDAVETKIRGHLRKTASELGLDANKTIKLELSPQLGYCLRVTKKVGVYACTVSCHLRAVVVLP